jgi:hypothetical protein
MCSLFSWQHAISYLFSDSFMVLLKFVIIPTIQFCITEFIEIVKENRSKLRHPTLYFIYAESKKLLRLVFSPQELVCFCQKFWLSFLLKLWLTKKLEIYWKKFKGKNRPQIEIVPGPVP